MLFDYKGLFDCSSICDIDLHGDLVIATELEENHGTSITNFAENLATQVCKRYNIPFGRLIWVEHYKHKGNDDYSLVCFDVMQDGLNNARWRKTSKERINLLIENNESINVLNERF